MTNIKDIYEPYWTIESNGYSEIVVERSKFIGYAFPVRQLDFVDQALSELRAEHHSARHICYAYRVGLGKQVAERANDDGEPSKTAGFPILNLLTQREITNVVIFVVRYFGGVKLGTGGLVRAYSESSLLALEDASPVQIFPQHQWFQDIPYSIAEKFEHHLRDVQSLKVESKSYTDCVTFSLAVQYPYLDDARRYVASYLHCDPTSIAPIYDSTSTNEK